MSSLELSPVTEPDARDDLRHKRWLRVAFFPDVSELSGNPYWPLLQRALEEQRAHFQPHAQFNLGWLRAHRHTVDVLHFHYVQQFYSYEEHYARLRWVVRLARNLVAARSLGYRTVFTLHNLSPTYPLRPAWVDYLGHWAMANLTDSVIVHCQGAREALRERFGRRRGVHVIPHPHFVDVYPASIDRQTARARLGLPASDTVFGFVGGVRPNKGVEHLLHAFARIPDQNVWLVIAGKPWPPPAYIERIREVASRDPRVRLHLDFIPDDELQVYMIAADVVVAPFESILTSGSTVMAMSFGRPVIVPARGCLPELISPEVGLLYDPEDPDSLLGALLEACRTRDLAAMGMAARSRVGAYTWKSMAERTLAIYGHG